MIKKISIALLSVLTISALGSSEFEPTPKEWNTANCDPTHNFIATTNPLSGNVDTKTRNTISEGLLAALIGLIAALSASISGYLVARYSLKQSANDAESARLEAHLFESLSYFAGEEESRSLGIAIIEANWKSKPLMRETWKSVLVQQALLILLSTKDATITPYIENDLRSILRVLTHSDPIAEQIDEMQKVLATCDQRQFSDAFWASWNELTSTISKTRH